MIRLTHQPIDAAAVIEAVRSPMAGAVVLFLGTAREVTGRRRTVRLEYESYGQMAEAQLRKLEAEARDRFALVDCVLVHRLGHIDIGQTSVAVAASAAHRQAAFDAGKWLIDRIKQVVPIWKKEHWEDGTSQWVHPGMDTPITGEQT